MTEKVKSRVIKLKETTISRIARYGVFGDTWDSILNKILDVVEGKKPRK